MTMGDHFADSGQEVGLKDGAGQGKPIQNGERPRHRTLSVRVGGWLTEFMRDAGGGSLDKRPWRRRLRQVRSLQIETPAC